MYNQNIINIMFSSGDHRWRILPDLRPQPLGKLSMMAGYAKSKGTLLRNSPSAVRSAAHTGRRELSAWVPPNHRRDAARNLPAGLLVQNPQLLGDSGPTGETGRAGELHEKHGIARLAPDDADDS